MAAGVSDMVPTMDMVGRDGYACSEIVDHVESIAAIKKQVSVVTQLYRQRGKAAHHFSMTGKSFHNGKGAGHFFAQSKTNLKFSTPTPAVTSARSTCSAQPRRFSETELRPGSNSIAAVPSSPEVALTSSITCPFE